ncbi:hypothetical protein [Lysinibacillus fusiformis]|uniref:hypothetical protein n=1 Tax=Lysinibacillus fusiformis TaxID=28031 RepID=UPI003CFBCD38
MAIDSTKVNEVIEVSLGWVDVVSIFSGAASLVMAVLAIWLSITFYKMSDASAKEMKDSTNKIDSNVAKLEKMFDTMYADTFTMVKDTVEHMRGQVESKTLDSKLETEISAKIERNVTEKIEKMGTYSFNNHEELKNLVFELIRESNSIKEKVVENALSKRVYEAILENDSMTYWELKKLFLDTDENISSSELFSAFVKLVEEGYIEESMVSVGKNGKKLIKATQKIKIKK